MAATYGYGGEFSSDEDIDKMEQQTERMAQSKFDAYSQQRPNKRQIEEAIETIKKLPLDQDVRLTDELLAGLLDHYKTQRGPIVDSTRNLYKKIILRLVRGDKPQAASNGNDLGVQKETNGNSVFNNNNNNLVSKEIEIISSDEEEEPKALNSHLLPEYTSQTRKSNPTPMEVDLEDANNIVPKKGNHISSSDGTTSESSSEDDDGDDDGDDDDNDNEGAVQHVTGSNDQKGKDQVEETSDSEVLDVTPPKEDGIKQVRSTSERTIATEARKKALKFDEKESAAKEQQKRHFTRSSQRVATRATAAAKARQADVSSGKVDEVASASLASNQNSNLSMPKKPLVGKTGRKVIISALLVAVVAFVLFYFKDELTRSTDGLLKRAIKF